MKNAKWFAAIALLCFVSISQAARNGSGTYSLPSGNPVTSGTTISSNWANTTLSDIANELTNSVARDGQSPMTANLPMGGFKITNLGNGSATTDAATVSNVNKYAMNQGSSDPGSIGAYSWWADTGNSLLKQRNSGNSAWVTIGPLLTHLADLSGAGGTVPTAQLPAGTISAPGILQLTNSTSSTSTTTAATPASVKSAYDLASATNSLISYGTYTPTTIGTTNVSGAVTYSTFFYSRNGNIVTVSGKLDAVPVSAATATYVNFSLPIASTFAADTDMAGGGAAASLFVGGTTGAIIGGNHTSNCGTAAWVSLGTINNDVYFTAQYIVRP